MMSPEWVSGRIFTLNDVLVKVAWHFLWTKLALLSNGNLSLASGLFRLSTTNFNQGKQQSMK